MAKRSFRKAGRLFLVLAVSWCACAEIRSDDTADLSAGQMKNLRGKLDSMTQALVQRRKQQLLAKHHQDTVTNQNVENLVHNSGTEETQLPAVQERRVVQADFTHSRKAASKVDPPVEAVAVATQSLEKMEEARKPVLVAPEYKNGKIAPLGATSARFASSKTEQKSKQGAMDAKNPWWLNPPPWWLPPPPEWGSPPPSIYSGFYNPGSQPQSFHRTPPSQPAYHPYPLPY